MADVPIVGAGQVGLPLACELARHGARCRIVDGAAQPSPYCRAIVVTPRTLEVWEDMGLAREMIDAGLWLTGLRTVLYGQPPVDALSPPLDLPYASLGLPQSETERVLTRHLERCGLRVERGLRLTALEQDDAGVRVRLQDDGGAVAEAGFRHVVGCDGAHSTVRRPLADLQGGGADTGYVADTDVSLGPACRRDVLAESAQWGARRMIADLRGQGGVIVLRIRMERLIRVATVAEVGRLPGRLLRPSLEAPRGSGAPRQPPHPAERGARQVFRRGARSPSPSARSASSRFGARSHRSAATPRPRSGAIVEAGTCDGGSSCSDAWRGSSGGSATAGTVVSQVHSLPDRRGASACASLDKHPSSLS